MSHGRGATEIEPAGTVTSENKGWNEKWWLMTAVIVVLAAFNVLLWLLLG